MEKDFLLTYQNSMVSPDDFNYQRCRDIFNSLVNNAIEFLGKSVEELETSPKYSLINFCTAVELFLKARLFKEDWKLILSNKREIKNYCEEKLLLRIESGDFHSVSIENCIRRLTECHVHIPEKARRHFIEISKHRNKMIHFYHPSQIKEPFIYSVFPVQWAAWFHLHELISTHWCDSFYCYLEEIERCHLLVTQNLKYLKIKRKEVEPEIEKEKKAGVKFIKCTVCGFKTVKCDDLCNLVYSYSCMVCSAQFNQIHILCPECQKDIIIKDQSNGRCTVCDFETNIDFLISEYGPTWNPKEETKIAYCAECEFPEPSVIPFGEYEDKGLCLNCNSLYNSVGKCMFCHELVAGIDFDISYECGCIFCKGVLGQ